MTQPYLSYFLEKRSEVVDIFWNESHNLVKCVYKRSGNPQEIVTVTLDILEVLFAKQTGNIMHDLRQLKSLLATDPRAMYDRDSYELYMQTVTHSAMVCTPDYEFRQALETISQHTTVRYETRFFDNPTQAEAWLVSISD